MLHDRPTLGYVAGGLAAAAAHVLDAIEDSITLAPVHLLGVGSIVALLVLAIPAPRRLARCELVEFRAATIALLARVPRSPSRPPGSDWTRSALVIFADRLLAGERVAVAELDALVVEVQGCGSWRVERLGVDAYAEDRAHWLVVAARCRSDLLIACDAYDAVAPDVDPREHRTGVLVERRFAARLTQAELAAKLGVAPRTVIRWEMGEREPTVAHRRELARLLGGRPSDYEEEYA